MTISARGSLMPAGDGSAILSDTLSPTRQWGREKSAPRSYETDPFRKAPQFHLNDLSRDSDAYIYDSVFIVFHVVRFEVWACARAKLL